MRNLLEYPVTLDEIVACLERLRDEALRAECVGDMTPMLLNMAIAAVRYRELKLGERGDIEGMRRALGSRQDAAQTGTPKPSTTASAKPS